MSNILNIVSVFFGGVSGPIESVKISTLSFIAYTIYKFLDEH